MIAHFKTFFRDKTNRWLTAIFAVVAAVVLFHELGDFRTLASHEVYAAVPAREMLESGNWTVPRFGGLPRLRKPPLVYWILASTTALCGELNELVLRLPSAISALLLSVLIGFWASRWYGRTAGWAAAFVQLTSVYLLVFSRKAEVDMLLCLLTTAAMFLVANQPVGELRRQRFLRWAGIWALLSVAWLGKFHYGPAMVIAPCGLFLLIEKRFRDVLNFFNPLGLLLFAAAVFIWPYLLLQQVPDAWEVWQRETVGRAVGKMGHEPVWYYVPHLFWLIVPWTPFVVAAVPNSWKRAWKQADSHERFLWIWFLTQFAIVTMSANKHKHYLNTTLPMASLLAAQKLSQWVTKIQRHEWRFRQSSAIVCAVMTLILAAALAVVGHQKYPQSSTAFLAIGGIVGIGGLLANWFAVRQQFKIAAILIAATFLGSYATANSFIMPHRDHRLAVADFAKDVRQELTNDRVISVYRMGETSVVYYLNSPVQRTEKLESLAAELQQAASQKTGASLYVVTFESFAKEIQSIGQTRILKRMTNPSNSPPPKHEPLVLIELTVFSSETAP